MPPVEISLAVAGVNVGKRNSFYLQILYLSVVSTVKIAACGYRYIVEAPHNVYNMGMSQ